MAILYSCKCDQRVIEIPTRVYFSISDNELERLCTESNFPAFINDVWYGAILDTHGVILTQEEIELEDEKEYEEDDPSYSDLNIPDDYWS